MFNVKRIDHVQLAGPKGCEDEARLFYRDQLEFDEVEKPEALKKNGGVWFSNGSVDVHIGVDEPFHPAKKAHPAFEVDGLDAFAEHLNEVGVSVKWDDQLPGAKRFYVSDPFDNRLEFLEWLT